ncbi:MAG: mannose-6-phosphate isomerase [Sphingomonadales bacterium]|nr:mannose-6-phosphate isomerase [Sphingomonadales bacterium]
MSVAIDSPVANDSNLKVPFLWRFRPQYFHKIWGGDRLQVFLKKDVGGLKQCGESWELSDVPPNPSQVAEGPCEGMSLPDVLHRFGSQIMGKQWTATGTSVTRFPLLIKFLDAREDLSVQVHPNDVLAQERHGCPGKTEMWYVLEAEPEATLITGFRGEMDPETYTRMLQAGRIMEMLNQEPVAAGDVFFIPAGRIHTIGRGIVLAEIQQSSDITYRLYDFDRVDERGERRELHTEEAIDALDFRKYNSYRTSYSEAGDAPVELVNCPYFRTFLLKLTRPMERVGHDHLSFRVYMAVQGSGYLEAGDEHMEMKLGDTVLVSAQAGCTRITPGFQGLSLLETGLPALNSVVA